jgi:hypothetical protein
VEHGISVMSRLFAASLTLSLVLCWTAVRGAEEVVLVVGENSPIEKLSPLELRKAYFGIVVRYDNQIIRPFRNSSDPQLNRIFLQSVVAMSERSVRALRDHPNSISYMWRSDAERSVGIKVIKLLWQEN